MQEKYTTIAQDFLSEARLAPYRHDGVSEREALARYLWNIAVSESLYSSLHLFEVCLRNAIHNAMTTLVGSDEWYDSFTLVSRSRKMLKRAKDNVADPNKKTSPGKIVAELSLGFWTVLYDKEYERKDTRLIHAGMPRVFPNLEQSIRTRKYVNQKLDVIRVLRNRVYHYERIIHWTDLSEQHELVIEMLGWMNPLLPKLCAPIDRFLPVYTQGTEPYMEQIKSSFCP